jgi:hypothetical protein
VPRSPVRGSDARDHADPQHDTLTDPQVVGFSGAASTDGAVRGLDESIHDLVDHEVLAERGVEELMSCPDLTDDRKG